MKRTRGRPKKVDVEKKEKIIKGRHNEIFTVGLINELALCLSYFSLGAFFISNEWILLSFAGLFLATFWLSFWYLNDLKKRYSF